MENAQHLLETLEDLLVKEFRSLQNLVALTKEERRVLSAYNQPQELLSVVEQKEALLDELGKLEDATRILTVHWANHTQSGSSNASATVGEIIAAQPAALSERLGRLRAGIRTLAKDMHDLNRGNQLLVSAGLDRTLGLQQFLFNLSK